VPDRAAMAVSREALDDARREAVLADDARLVELYESSLAASGAKLYCHEIGSANIVWRSATPEFFGHPLETVSRLAGWRAIVVPDDRGRLDAWIAEANSQELGPTRLTYRITAGDGSICWLESHGQLQWRDGRPWRALGFVIDVTQRAVLEQELLLHSKIIEAIADGVTLSSGDGKILMVNREIERAYGWSRDELVGQSTRVFSGLKAPDHDRLRDYVRAVVARDGMWKGETRERHRDGTVLRVRRTLSLLQHGSEQLWVGTRTDVTQLRQLERQILLASEQEQQRVASGLHEELGQKLTGASLVATKVAREARERDDGSHTQLANLAALLSEAVGDCRRLAQQVRGFALQSAGLELSFRALLIRFESEHDVACSGFVEPEMVDELDAERCRMVYKIAADMLAAAVAVGAPTMINVELGRKAGQAKLCLSDDGIAAFSEDHLRVIRYQATSLDANVETTSHAEGGRTLECIFPIA